MTRALRALLLAGAAALMAASPVAAADLGPPVDDAVLADLRGGFVVVDGLTLDFAAEIRSFVDGELALETRITLDGRSSVLTDSGGALSPEALAALSAGGLDLGDLKGGVFVSADGQTAILHRTEDGLANILLNTGDHRDFRQELNLTLTLPGFEGLQGQIQAMRVGQDLVDQITHLSAGLN